MDPEAQRRAGLPLALANTVYTLRGKVHDDLGTPADLAEWLHREADGLRTRLPGPAALTATEDDLRDARDLREALRAILAAVAEGRPPDDESRYRLNWRAAAAPSWPQLRWEAGPVRELASASEPVAAALSEIAGAAVDLFAAEAEKLSACASPECVRYFARVDPRRKWCSPECGNRARVARHYHKSRD